MALCLVAILALVAISFGPDRLVVRLVALALFGAGLGLFLAPNSHATIDAAPAGHAASAGGLVNLGRVLGSCLGVSAASSMLSWRLGLSRAADTMGPAFVEAVAGSPASGWPPLPSSPGPRRSRCAAASTPRPGASLTTRPARSAARWSQPIRV
jgi:hypothetical protein